MRLLVLFGETTSSSRIVWYCLIGATTVNLTISVRTLAKDCSNASWINCKFYWELHIPFTVSRAFCASNLRSLYRYAAASITGVRFLARLLFF